jgi:L-cystine uptake protein TcyP (sodium:dicarboxylate symporter family)
MVLLFCQIAIYKKTFSILNDTILKFLTFGNLKVKDMKKIVIPIMIIAILVALYEQLNARKNVCVMVVAIVFFMFGMLRLSSKTPSKNQEKEEDNV